MAVAKKATVTAFNLRPIVGGNAKVVEINVLNQNLGIENIKTAFGILIEVGQAIDDFRQTGFNIANGLDFVFTLGQYVGKLDVFKKSLAEFRDLDTAESVQVSKHIKQKFDISNDELEARIERIIDLLPRTYLHVRETVDLVLEWGVAVRGLKTA